MMIFIWNNRPLLTQGENKLPKVIGRYKVEIQSTPPITQPHLTTVEEKSLCRAWIEVIDDPIVGVCQTGLHM